MLWDGEMVNCLSDLDLRREEISRREISGLVPVAVRLDRDNATLTTALVPN